MYQIPEPELVVESVGNGRTCYCFEISKDGIEVGADTISKVKNAFLIEAQEEGVLIKWGSLLYHITAVFSSDYEAMIYMGEEGNEDKVILYEDENDIYMVSCEDKGIEPDAFVLTEKHPVSHRDGERDNRFSITVEHTGIENPVYVSRFCGEYIGGFEKYPQALAALRNQKTEKAA